ncbi:cell division protein FtsA [bacterium]|nr:cell division protein FtsA [bacterium]
MIEKRLNRREDDRQIFAGLDIGTSKIGVVIGELDQYERLQILGVGISPSKGMRQGVVINLDQAVISIRQAVQEAQLTAGIEVNNVVVGIAGDHIRSVNSRGVVAVSSGDHEIVENDVERVIDAAKAIALPIDREVLHVIPQEYLVDNQGGIKNPVGISGVRLEAEVHIVTGAVTSAQNIVRCVNKAGLNVNALVLEPLASSFAVLDENEKELGIGLIDIGGGTTDIAIFSGNAIRNTTVIGLGGQNVTNDVALGLRTPVEQAEQIKIKFGRSFSDDKHQQEIFMVPGLGGRQPREVTRDLLTKIIQPRMEEIFSLAAKEIKRSEFGDRLGAGIVLTGGAAMLDGATELAEQIFEMPVKLGVPQGFFGLTECAATPMLATGVGLVFYATELINTTENNIGPEEDTLFTKIRDLMKGWTRDLFGS